MVPAAPRPGPQHVNEHVPELSRPTRPRSARLGAGLNLAGIAMVIDLQDENTQLRAEQQEQQLLNTAPTPQNRSTRQTSASTKPRPTRSR